MKIWTVGHSRHSFSKFLALLKPNGITMIVDVRSHPFSRWRHFNCDNFSRSLGEQSIDYRYSGSLLGGRYEVSIYAEPFVAEMEAVLQLTAEGHLIALMCAESRFYKCHRAGKLTAWLHRNHSNVVTTHILPDGSTVDARENENKILNSVWWHELER